VTKQELCNTWGASETNTFVR